MAGESGGSSSGCLRDERLATAVYGGRINGKQQVYIPIHRQPGANTQTGKISSYSDAPLRTICEPCGLNCLSLPLTEQLALAPGCFEPAHNRA
jgi:hypothetical protein